MQEQDPHLPSDDYEYDHDSFFSGLSCVAKATLIFQPLDSHLLLKYLAGNYFSSENIKILSKEIIDAIRGIEHYGTLIGAIIGRAICVLAGIVGLLIGLVLTIIAAMPLSIGCYLFRSIDKIHSLLNELPAHVANIVMNISYFLIEVPLKNIFNFIFSLPEILIYLPCLALTFMKKNDTSDIMPTTAQPEPQHENEINNDLQSQSQPPRQNKGDDLLEGGDLVEPPEVDTSKVGKSYREGSD